jgi:hypothetical protein
MKKRNIAIQRLSLKKITIAALHTMTQSHILGGGTDDLQQSGNNTLQASQGSNCITVSENCPGPQLRIESATIVHYSFDC